MSKEIVNYRFEFNTFLFLGSSLYRFEVYIY